MGHFFGDVWSDGRVTEKFAEDENEWWWDSAGNEKDLWSDGFSGAASSK